LSPSAEERLRQVLDRSVAFAILLTPDGTVTHINQHALEVGGLTREQVVGHPLWDQIWWSYDPEVSRRIRASVDEAARGQPVRFDVKVQSADGRRTIIDLQIAPVSDGRGKVAELVLSAVDVSERVMAQRQLEHLLAEMSHRMKNFLTTVHAIARMTERTARPEAAFREFAGRLDALNVAHDALNEAGTADEYFEQLARRLLRPYAEGELSRFRISGPKIAISPNDGRAIALCLYELATNAVKYGALSNRSGQVRVRLTEPARDGQVTFSWQETGGPPVTAPTRQGYGTQFVITTLGGIIGGDVRTEYRPEGFCLIVSGPATSFFVKSSALPPAQPEG
jgi:PAS domain S-box-containing protein